MDWNHVNRLWIIVKFGSAVWSLILTAPIHCRGSIAEQVMQCYIFRLKHLLNICHCTKCSIKWKKNLKILKIMVLLRTVHKKVPKMVLLWHFFKTPFFFVNFFSISNTKLQVPFTKLHCLNTIGFKCFHLDFARKYHFHCLWCNRSYNINQHRSFYWTDFHMN